jgi:hypothetical protein
MTSHQIAARKKNRAKDSLDKMMELLRPYLPVPPALPEQPRRKWTLVSDQTCAGRKHEHVAGDDAPQDSDTSF